uniref:XPG-I domain-containing protein n=1 Tax=viral metagenome TaxID=1070528 RepID=A0A6C0DCH2_9ZZZZ
MPDFTTPGQIWGIDCSCLLFKARGANLDILTVLAGLLVKLLHHRIRPIVVFDGFTGGGAKADLLESRRQERQKVASALEHVREAATKAQTVTEKETCALQEAALQKKAPMVSRTDRDELKQFLHMAGVLFVTVRGEADDFLAALAREGKIHAVLTTDTDAFARGIPRVIVPETSDATVLIEWSLTAVLKGLMMPYDTFIRMCALMGSDYTSSSMPVPKAMRLAVAEDTVLTDEQEEAVRLLRGVGVGAEDMLDSKQKERWAIGSFEKEPQELTELVETKGWPRSWMNILLTA